MKFLPTHSILQTRNVLRFDMADYLHNFDALRAKVGDDKALLLWKKWYGSTLNVGRGGGLVTVVGEPNTQKNVKSAAAEGDVGGNKKDG